MRLLFEILTWLGIVAAGLAVVGLFVVTLLAWLLNRPIDDEPEPDAGRC